MKVAIAAGGTGGHVYPAVAVAGALLSRNHKVHWFGRPSSLEETEARNLGVPYTAIPLQGLKRRWTLENLRALSRFVAGRHIAIQALRSQKPDVLFALGSYVSAPVVSAACSLKVPFALHEQNVVPGLVVARYARKAATVLLTRPLTGEPLKARSQVVGMPLREGIVLPPSPQWYADLGLNPERKTLFIFGGSQGARTLCAAGLKLAERWVNEQPDWQILMQTGVANKAWVEDSLSTGNVVPVGHLHQMGKAYACADVVVSRSGAVSCAEIEAVGKPAVLVPYPHATRNHQMLNAESFIQTNPGVLLEDSCLDAESLDRAALSLFGKRTSMGHAAASANPVDSIIDSLSDIARGGTR